MTKTRTTLTVVGTILLTLTASAALAQGQGAPLQKRTICVQGWKPAVAPFAYTYSFRIMACRPTASSFDDSKVTPKPEAATTETAVETRAKAFCTDRWPDDLVLRAACVRRQLEAAKELR